MQTSFGKPIHGKRINLMLLLQYPCRKTDFVVSVEHRNSRLNDDRSMIKFRRDKMNGTAMYTHAFLERPSVGMQTGVSGNSDG